MKINIKNYLGIVIFGSLAFANGAYANYRVVIRNNFNFPLTFNHTNNRVTISSGASYTTPYQISGESVNIEVPGYGNVVLSDLGDSHIDGDSHNSSEPWGVLISYQGMDVVGRYGGPGQLTMTLGKRGNFTLSGMTFRDVVIGRLVHS